MYSAHAQIESVLWCWEFEPIRFPSFTETSRLFCPLNGSEGGEARGVKREQR